MNKDIKKILNERAYGPYYLPGKMGWKDFWENKRSDYNKYTFWRFILATPFYFVIFIGQYLLRSKQGVVMVERDKIPPIIATDYTLGVKEDVRTWIRSMTPEERSDLQKLYDENALNSNKVAMELFMEKQNKKQPNAFYQDGALPIEFWNALKQISEGIAGKATSFSPITREEAEDMTTYK